MANVKSLSDQSDVQYVPGQVKNIGTWLHFQIVGTPGNRSYGWAGDLPLSPLVSDLPAPTVMSLNGAAEPSYTPAQFTPDTTPGTVKMQIAGAKPGNRPYGVILGYNAQDPLWQWLRQELAGPKGVTEDSGVE